MEALAEETILLPVKRGTLYRTLDIFDRAKLPYSKVAEDIEFTTLIISVIKEFNEALRRAKHLDGTPLMKPAVRAPEEKHLEEGADP